MYQPRTQFSVSKHHTHTRTACCLTHQCGHQLHDRAITARIRFLEKSLKQQTQLLKQKTDELVALQAKVSRSVLCATALCCDDHRH